MPDPKIAFIAVRGGSKGSGGPYEAVVVGAAGETGDVWRYARFPLDDLDLLLRALGRGEDVPHPLADQTDADVASALAKHHVIPHQTDGAADAPFVLRDIVRCTFYRYGLDPVDRERLRNRQRPADGVVASGLDDDVGRPLALFDTCRWDRPDGSTKPQPPADPAEEPTWRGSRLLLQPKAGKPTELAGFEVHLQVRTHIGAHDVFGHRPDELDARALVTLKAEQGVGRPSPSLWDTRPGAAPNPDRGARYNLLRIAVTVGAYVDEDETRRRTKEWEDEDLGALGRDTSKRVKWDFTVDPDILWPPALVPWAADKDDLPAQGDVKGEFGLRAAALNDAKTEVISLIARYELTVPNMFAGIGKAAEAFLPLLITSLGAERTTPLLVSQEQRAIAVDWVLTPPSTVRWLLAVRTDRVKRPGTAAAQRRIAAGVAKQLTEFSDRLGHDLLSVRDAAPLSLAPRITDVDAEWPWHAVGFLVDQRPHSRLLLDPDDWHNTNFNTRLERLKRRFRREFSTSLLTFEPRAVDDYWQASKQADPKVLEGKVEFPRLRLTDGSRPAGKAELSAYVRPGAEAAMPSPSTARPLYQPAIADVADPADAPIGTVFGLRVSLPAAPDAPIDTDVGALSFRLKRGPAAGLASDWQGMIHLRPMRRPGDPDDDRLSHALDAAILLPVEAVAPAGQDDPIEEQRITALDRIEGLRDRTAPAPDAPLFFPMGQADPSGALYKLAARETVTRAENHTVTLALQATQVDRPAPPGGQGPAPVVADKDRHVLVIDPAPFRVALVEYTEPATAASNESNEVAVWNAAGEGGLSWRVADESQTVRIALPTQVIGEAMEKNPVKDPETGKPSSLPPDIQPDKPAAARFGGATRLDFDPTYFDTRFREPGWNLSRILGFAGQRAPGARLRDLRLELIYGMTTRVTPREPVFVTEISGAIGVPALPLKEAVSSDRGAYPDYLRLANRMIRIERSRVAVEKLWRDTPDELLTLEAGVGFQLRRKEAGGGPLTKLRWPAPGELPSDPVPPLTKEELRETFSTDTDDLKSFPGGVAWAFESPNILMSVYGVPVSDGGRVRGVHLSALGAWGGQRALFDEKKTTIETETAQGRVHRYALERIGRIGGLWHRAKHVIVYERSVVPSAQFYNDAPINKGQDEHVGRPILRKVEEYVELLEPMRRYPEDGASVAAAGCMVGAEFKSRRIRVDSRWGADVRREGWKVPLWNKAFADLKPYPPNNPDSPALIYPKPQVRLIMAAEGGGEVGLEVNEPEKLVFYTSVVRGESGDDTDAWRPVRDVDFIDLPPPAAAKIKPRSEDLTDATLPGEPAHVAGFEPMTLGLSPTADRVAITHGRSAEGPAAVLRNITVARARPVVSRKEAVPTEGARNLAQHTADLRAELDRAVGQVLASLSRPDLGDLKGLAQLDKLKARAKQAVDEALDKVKTPKVITEIRKEARKIEDLPVTGACDRLKQQVDAQVAAQADRLQIVADRLLDDLEMRLNKPIEEGVTFVERKVQALKDAVAAGEDAFNKAKAEALRAVAGPGGVVARARDDARVIVETTRVRLAQLTDQLGDGLDKVSKGLADELGGVGAKLTAAQAAVSGGDWTIATAKAAEAAAVVRDKVRPLLRDPPPQLRAVAVQLGKLVDDAEWVLAEVAKEKDPDGPRRSELAKAIGAANQALTTFKEQLEARLGELGGEAGGKVRQVEAALDGLLVKTGEDLESVLKPAATVVAQLSAAVEAVEFGAPDWTQVDKFEGDVKTAAAGLRTGIAKQRADAGTLAAQSLDKARAAAGVLSAALENQCKVLEQAYLKSGIAEAAGWVDTNLDFERYKAELRAEAYALIDKLTGKAEEALEKLQRQATARAAEIARDWENKAQQFAAAAQDKVREVLGVDPVALGDRAERLYQQGSQTLQTLRALSEGPKTDVSQVLNRPEVALIYNELNKVVDMSPAIALANRAGDLARGVEQVNELLQSFGVRSPISRIGEQLMPDALKGLSVANLIPDIGGIDFRGLLQRAQFPDLDPGKAVDIRHGFDKGQMRAWLEAEIDIPFSETTTLLEFGPVQIAIDDARFYASARITLGKDGTKHSTKGRIAGDWRVMAAGQTVLTFRQTGLFFDETGKLDFRTSPEKVEVAEVLRFVTDLMAQSGQGEGLKVGPLMKGSIPTGVAATLDLKLPNLQTGAFGISDLWLHVLFGVSAIPEFELLCDLSVGSRMAPFTLNVWILNGGGYLTQRLSFLPAARPKPIMTYVLDIAIAAGVGLGFSFGVVSGGVWLQVGCGVAITWTTAEGGGSTAVRVFILARGNVDVAGLITASIALLLEVSYDGDLMLGTGTLSISVKISMFYTLNVNQRVEYQFAGKKKEQKNGSYSEAYE